MTQEVLNEIIKQHKLWLKDDKKGKRANLRFVDLSNANLRYADLSNANLHNADLSNADLSNADLRYANLHNADLNFANLLTFQFQRDIAYYQFDGYIRIGCELNKVSYWVENFKKIGKDNNYTELQIELYGTFINTCMLLDDTREKKND